MAMKKKKLSTILAIMACLICPQVKSQIKKGTQPPWKNNYIKVHHNHNKEVTNISITHSTGHTRNVFPKAANEVLYIQNQTFTNTNNINATYVFIGSNVTSEKERGAVIVENGNTTIKGYNELKIEGEFEVKKGAALIINNNI